MSEENHAATGAGSQAPPVVRRIPGMVIWAFVLSILGFCGVTAVVGLVLGIIGLKMAKRTGAGSGLAVASIVISAAWVALWLLSVLIGAINGGTPPTQTATSAALPGASAAASGTASGSGSPSPSQATDDYRSLLNGSEITTKGICSAYTSTITKYSETADKTIKDAEKYVADPYEAAAYRKKSPWVRQDYLVRFSTAMDKAATKAFDNLSGGRAGELGSIDAYLRDSLDGCELTSAYDEAVAKAKAVNELGQQIEDAANRKPWYPKGFQLYDDNLAYKWVDGGGYSCYGCSYWTMDVITSSGCPNGLYVELSITDGGGTVVDWTNELLPSLRAHQKARLQFATYNGNAHSAEISQVTCN